MPGTRRSVAARAVVALVALVVGAAAACSSDGPELSTWAAEATAICAEHQREADALGPAVAGPAQADALVAAAEISRDEVEALSGLPAPSERRDEVRAWLEALGRRVTALEAYAGAYEVAEPETSVAIPEELATSTQEAGGPGRRARAGGLWCRRGHAGGHDHHRRSGGRGSCAPGGRARRRWPPGDRRAGDQPRPDRHPGPAGLSQLRLVTATGRTAASGPTGRGRARPWAGATTPGAPTARSG